MFMKKIGFVGTGVMGKSMATNLIDAGYDVHIYTRTKEKATSLLEQGAIWQESVAILAAKVDVVITIVGYPSDVEEVYFGANGIIENANAGSHLIDMTTSSPKLAEKIAIRASEHGITAIDAPVSGGDIGAKNGSLAIMVGGDSNGFSTILPILEVMGKNIVHQGPAGAGQHTKMCNQITIASNMVGVCEAITYAEKAGLDPTNVLKSITTGAAGSWTLTNLAPRIIEGDYSPGFYVKHFIKDMKIALETAKDMGIMTPGLELSLSLYEQLAAEGKESSGTQALIQLFK